MPLRARAHWPLCSTTCGRVFAAGIFIPVGNHYFQALASTLQFVAVKGPEHTGYFVQPQVAAFCGGDIYSRRKPLFSSFGEHTAVCGC